MCENELKEGEFPYVFAFHQATRTGKSRIYGSFLISALIYFDQQHETFSKIKIPSSNNTNILTYKYLK